MNVKGKLLDYRALNNLTQQEVAVKIGLSRDIIMRVEAGRNVKTVTLRKIELFLEKNK